MKWVKRQAVVAEPLVWGSNHKTIGFEVNLETRRILPSTPRFAEHVMLDAGPILRLADWSEKAVEQVLGASSVVWLVRKRLDMFRPDAVVFRLRTPWRRSSLKVKLDNARPMPEVRLLTVVGGKTFGIWHDSPHYYLAPVTHYIAADQIETETGQSQEELRESRKALAAQERADAKLDREAFRSL